VADFYTNLKNVALRLLTSKGQSLTFTRPVTSSFNPATGVDTPATPITYSGYGAALNYNKSEIDGDLIQIGDIRLLLEATSTAVEMGDPVPIDSITYRVMNIRPLSPAGTVVAYELQLRK